MGLARIKAPRIKAALEAVYEKRGGFDIDFLRDLPLDEAKAWLRELNGVGPKTAACVLMFALGRPALPVDTHVHRVAQRLGLVPAKASAEKAHDILEAMLAPDGCVPAAHHADQARAAALQRPAAAMRRVPAAGGVPGGAAVCRGVWTCNSLTRRA